MNLKKKCVNKCRKVPLLNLRIATVFGQLLEYT